MTSHSLLLPLANCRKEYQHVKVMNKKYYTVCDSPKVNTLLRALARKVGGSGFWNLVLRKCQNNYQIYGEVAGSDPSWYINNWFLPWLPSVYPGRYLKLVLNNFLSHYPLLVFYLPLHCFMLYVPIHTAQSKEAQSYVLLAKKSGFDFQQMQETAFYQNRSDKPCGRDNLLLSGCRYLRVFLLDKVTGKWSWLSPPATAADIFSV